MHRSRAKARHQTAVAIIAALLLIIFALLGVVTPRLEDAYEARDLEPPKTTRLVLAAGRFVSNHELAVFFLILCLIGFLWTLFGTLDRPKGRTSEQRGA